MVAQYTVSLTMPASGRAVLDRVVFQQNAPVGTGGGAGARHERVRSGPTYLTGERGEASAVAMTMMGGDWRGVCDWWGLVRV